MPQGQVIKIRRDEQGRWSWRCPRCQEWTPTTEDIMETGGPVHCQACGDGTVLVSAPVTKEEANGMLIPKYGEA